MSGIRGAISAHDGRFVEPSYQCMGKGMFRSISAVENGGLLPTTVTVRSSNCFKAMIWRAAYKGSPSQTKPIETQDGLAA